MTTFVLIAVLLAVLSLALLTRPLWLRPRTATARDDAAAVAALRRQLEQLVALHKASSLGEAQFTEAKLALERRIVDAVVSPPAISAPARQPAPKALLLSLAGFIAMVAAGGYAALGTPQALDPEAAAAQAGAAGSEGGHTITAAQIDAMIEKLAARLKERPDDVDGWAMLGRSYAVLGRHELAVPAFKKAMALGPEDASLIADYADALAVTNNRRSTAAPEIPTVAEAGLPGYAVTGWYGMMLPSAARTWGW